MIEIIKRKIRVQKKILSLINPNPQSINKIEFSLTKELDKHNRISTLITNSHYGNLKIIHKPNSKNNKINTLFRQYCAIEFLYNITGETFVLEDLTYEKKMGF